MGQSVHYFGQTSQSPPFFERPGMGMGMTITMPMTMPMPMPDRSKKGEDNDVGICEEQSEKRSEDDSFF